jgi:hypothetical protein
MEDTTVAAVGNIYCMAMASLLGSFAIPTVLLPAITAPVYFGKKVNRKRDS